MIYLLLAALLFGFMFPTFTLYALGLSLVFILINKGIESESKPRRKKP